MSVLELKDNVCTNDGCSRRFTLGWGGICEDCAAMAQDHAALHAEPMIECADCF